MFPMFLIDINKKASVSSKNTGLKLKLNVLMSFTVDFFKITIRQVR